MKTTIFSIILAVVLIIAAFLLAKNGNGPESSAGNPNNVSIVDGKQIVEIRAKGGYLPRKSVAVAGIPTILRFETSGTFDCSSAVRVPSLNISKILPQTGATDVEIGIPEAKILQGSCGMGMYPFEVEFKTPAS